MNFDLPILWRRLDRPGHESARVENDGEGWRLSGCAVLAHEGRACRLDYAVRCDARWRTVSARVSGWIGGRTVEHAVEVDGDGRWRLDGRVVPEVDGCVDVDLNFSPSTNLLPIRRLDLPVGGEGEVRAAWLRFPGFELEPLEQTYRRLSENVYRYKSAGGRFTADLQVDARGMITLYPGFATVDVEGG